MPSLSWFLFGKIVWFLGDQLVENNDMLYHVEHICPVNENESAELSLPIELR